MGSDYIPASIIAGCPRLRALANCGGGVEKIDLRAATARGIVVTNTPAVMANAAADLAFGLLLATARHFIAGDRLVRSGTWQVLGPSDFAGLELDGATLGLIGFGHIGQAMARRARGFGLRVIYWNRTRLSSDAEAAHGVEYCERDALLAEADIVSVHVASKPETRHLIDAAALGRMRRTAILINTARGAIVDEAALARALHDGTIAGAGLDVFEREPAVHPELLTAPNTTFLPHIGSATVKTRRRMAMIAAENLLAALRGERPPNCVNPEVLRHE
jgi:glyoxylate reductase